MPTKPRTSPPLAQAAAPFDWRAHLQVHPEAEHFRPMNETEFEELVTDIKSNGLNTPIVIWSGEDAKPQLLDGRNRLDALARLGLLYAIDGHLCVKMWIDKQKQWATSSGDRIQAQHVSGGDPLLLAISLNFHRRHLDADDKRKLIVDVLKARPELSNLAIAKQVGRDDKTVAKVRTELERRSDIPTVARRTDTKGRTQPAKQVHGARAKGKTSPSPKVPLSSLARGDATLEQQRRFLDGIGQKALLAAWPPTWPRASVAADDVTARPATASDVIGAAVAVVRSMPQPGRLVFRRELLAAISDVLIEASDEV